MSNGNGEGQNAGGADELACLDAIADLAASGALPKGFAEAAAGMDGFKSPSKATKKPTSVDELVGGMGISVEDMMRSLRSI